MIKIISLPIQFSGHEYYTLIRVRNKPDRLELKITIMNGELEKALYGNNIFECKNGYLIADIPVGDDHTARLKLAVLRALEEYSLTNPLSLQ